MNILQMSEMASYMILVILLLRKIFLNNLPKDFMFLLWLIVMVRLIVPVRFHLPIVFDEIAEPAFSLTGERSTKQLESYYMNFTGNQEINITQYLWIIWIIGGAILLTFFLYQQMQNQKVIHQAIPYDSNLMISHWRHNHKAYAKVKILCSDQISSPIAVGCIRKRIIFPKGTDIFNKNELHYILLHELHHLYHYDNLWRFCMMICLCLHWFNPMIWIAFYTFNNDLEIACDKYVLNTIGSEEKASYAETLLHMAEQFQSCTIQSSGFSKHPVKERIVTIMKYKKTTSAILFCGIIALSASTFVFAQTNAQKTIPSTNPVSTEDSVSTNGFTKEEFSKLVEVYRSHKSEIQTGYKIDDASYQQGLIALEWQLNTKKSHPDYHIPDNTTTTNDIEKAMIISIHAQNYMLEAINTSKQ